MSSEKLPYRRANTGNAIAGGSRAAVNTNTGRVIDTAAVAGRNASGAAAIGGFNTEGKGGDAKGAGYVKYDRATGDVSKGGIANINDSIYAGKDGNVYKYDKGDGWQQVGGDGNFNKATQLPSAGNIDSDRFARERGADRAVDRSANDMGSRGNASMRQFDRSNYTGQFKGRMGGTRPAAGGGRYGGGGGGRRR
jgi:hypothetical protein